MASYDPNAEEGTGDNTIASIRKYAEDNNLADASAFPPHLGICNPLCVWLQKAHNARAAAVTYAAEQSAPPPEE